MMLNKRDKMYNDMTACIEAAVKMKVYDTYPFAQAEKIDEYGALVMKIEGKKVKVSSVDSDMIIDKYGE